MQIDFPEVAMQAHQAVVLSFKTACNWASPWYQDSPRVPDVGIEVLGNLTAPSQRLVNVCYEPLDAPFEAVSSWILNATLP